MSTKTKRILMALGVSLALLLSGTSLTACKSKADVASSNLSKDADNFQVLRRIVFYNGITNEYLLEIVGYCSLGNEDKPNEISVTCKTQTKGVDGAKEDGYKKHFLGLSDNVTYWVEQINSVGVSANHYEVVFRPTTIVPDPVVR